MGIVRGIMVGLVACLAMTATPAQAAAPEPAAEADRQGASNNWENLRTWKHGFVRGCRSTWDGETFHLKVQLVNRADHGRRGAAISARSGVYPDWSRQDYGTIGSGEKSMILDVDVYERPRVVDVRAKVTKEKVESTWSSVRRMDRLNIC